MTEHDLRKYVEALIQEKTMLAKNLEDTHVILKLKIEID